MNLVCQKSPSIAYQIRLSRTQYGAIRIATHLNLVGNSTPYPAERSKGVEVEVNGIYDVDRIGIVMPNLTSLVVVGAATALLDVIDLVAAINADIPRFTIVGALDDNVALHGTSVGGIKVWGDLSLARGLSDVRFVFAISSYKIRLQRIGIFEALGIAREMFVTLVHPRADVSQSATLGHGCAIFGNCFVGTQAKLGDFCIAYNSAFLSPYCELSDFAMVAGLAFIGPSARLGKGAFAGATSSIAPGISVGTGGMIGLASAVFENVPPGAVMLGNPAKQIRSFPVPPHLLES